MTSGAPGRTFLAECYAPGIDAASVGAAAARAREAVRRLASAGDLIEYRGATLVAGDEVVFHAFAADDADLVERACLAAALGHERVVESVEIGPAPAGRAPRRTAGPQAPTRRRRRSAS